jgi:hypothetical protein
LGAYAEGLRRGGALVFVTGSDPKVADAANLVNRQGAALVEETNGGEPDLSGMLRENAAFVRDRSRLNWADPRTGRGRVCFCVVTKNQPAIQAHQT